MQITFDVRHHDEMTDDCTFEVRALDNQSHNTIVWSWTIFDSWWKVTDLDT
jgi:hypothetical protein